MVRGFTPPRRMNFAIVQIFEQLGLQSQRQIADFVQEERTLVGQFEQPRFALLAGPGKGPALIAEELRLQQTFRQGRTIDGDERLFAPAAVHVDKPGHQPLARSRLSQNQDVGGVQTGQLEGHRQDLAHFLALRDNGLILERHQPQLGQLVTHFFRDHLGLLEFLADNVQLGHVPLVDHDNVQLPLVVKDRRARCQEIAVGAFDKLHDADLTSGFHHLQGDRPIEKSPIHQLADVLADDLFGLDPVELRGGLVDVDHLALVVAYPESVGRGIKDRGQFTIQPLIGLQFADRHLELAHLLEGAHGGADGSAGRLDRGDKQDQVDDLAFNLVPQVGFTACDASHDLRSGQGQQVGDEAADMAAGIESQNFFGLPVDVGQAPLGVGDQNAIDGGVENILIADGGGHPAALLSFRLIPREVVRLHYPGRASGTGFAQQGLKVRRCR